MPSSTDALGRDAARAADHARSDADRLGRDAGRIADRVRDSAPEFVRQARDVFDERFGDLRDQGREYVREYASAAGDGLEDARSFMVDRVQERPITATLAALGVGFLMGLLISGSRR
ncbi:MAG: hypothetical protein INR64_00800 [Caulobacteraceae bacterium]|nr:hypothetical protein [Caulobacter sp.]